MGPPECSRYEVTLALARQLTAADRAIRDLHCYLISFGGAKFDQLANRQRPDEFTSEDFQAVRRLNVSVLVRARQSCSVRRSLRSSAFPAPSLTTSTFGRSRQTTMTPDLGPAARPGNCGSLYSRNRKVHEAQAVA
jgi:hypothetical protein